VLAGTYEQDDSRVYRSSDWWVQSDSQASGGSYITDGGTNNSAAWFPFTGDSVTYHAMAYSQGDKVAISIDDNLVGYLDLYNPTMVTRTLSFGALGPGPHVLQVRHYRVSRTWMHLQFPARRLSTSRSHVPASSATKRTTRLCSTTVSR